VATLINVYLAVQATVMNKPYFNYYSGHEAKLFPEQKQLITYSFAGEEFTIVGNIEIKEPFIYLYEYRGLLVGTEFLISFAKASTSYKLVNVVAVANDQ
jgi:hypothetical protein